MSVRKMAVVPQTFIDTFMQAQREEQQLVSNNPVIQLSSLDRDMKSVLESNIPSDVKAKKYAQVLHTFSNIRDKQAAPLSAPPPLQNQKLDFTTGLARQYINKGKLLVDHLMNQHDVQWNDKNEVIYKGDLIPGSNIIDLVHTFTKQRTALKPRGWKEFAQTLVDSNVPQSAIGNRRLLEEASGVGELEEFDSVHQPVPQYYRTYFDGSPDKSFVSAASTPKASKTNTPSPRKLEPKWVKEATPKKPAPKKPSPKKSSPPKPISVKPLVLSPAKKSPVAGRTRGRAKIRKPSQPSTERWESTY
jgi:hypothetical protein